MKYDTINAKTEKLLQKAAELKQNDETRNNRNFNIFDLCRVGTRETTHSAIIASFLDPKGTHGLGEEPLELFLKQCGINISILELQDVQVDTEYWIESGSRRLDIVIYGKSICVVIENKTESSD